jgi:hypothetical protein
MWVVEARVSLLFVLLIAYNVSREGGGNVRAKKFPLLSRQHKKIIETTMNKKLCEMRRWLDDNFS